MSHSPLAGLSPVSSRRTGAGHTGKVALAPPHLSARRPQPAKCDPRKRYHHGVRASQPTVRAEPPAAVPLATGGAQFWVPVPASESFITGGLWCFSEST